MGPRGHYSEDKSLFGLLRPKRSLDKSLNGKEIKEIQYQVGELGYPGLNHNDIVTQVNKGYIQPN